MPTSIRILSRSSLPLGALALSVALAGCGGSSGGLTRAQLVSKANAVCAANVAAGHRITQPTNIRDANQAARYFNAVEPIAAKGTADLVALRPDKAASADWSAYIASRRAGLALLQTLQQKANAHDPTGLADLRRSGPVQQRIIAAATKLGATQCTH